jgi:hypothetical protein
MRVASSPRVAAFPARARRRRTERARVLSRAADSRDAVVVVQPYDCVEYVDAATGESKIAAVVGVSPDDATIVLRALVRSESEPRAFLCMDDDANDVVASRAYSRATFRRERQIDETIRTASTRWIVGRCATR